MKERKYLRLLFIITIILIFSLIIGNVIMAPIIIYYKLLVQFFGWLFLFLIFILSSGKFYANFRLIKFSSETATSQVAILKKTLRVTFSQIMQKSAGFIMYLAFLIFIGSLTIFAIWLNSKIFNITVN